MMEIYADDNGFHRWFHRIVWPDNMHAKMIRPFSRRRVACRQSEMENDHFLGVSLFSSPRSSAEKEERASFLGVI